MASRIAFGINHSGRLTWADRPRQRVCGSIGGGRLKCVTGEVSAGSVGASMLKRLVEVVGSKSRIATNEVSQILTAVGEVTREELGVQESQYHGRLDLEMRKLITFLNITEQANYSLGIFVMPPNTTIPLHDHPGMTVFTKVLWGELEVEAYDIVAKCQGDNNEYVALKRGTSLTRDNEVRYLTKDNGNIHQFHAKKWTAVFDLAVPPYDPWNGRPCNYFRVLGDATSENGTGETDSVVMETRDCPYEYRTTRGIYTGTTVD
eukprot:CAMPEP_0184754370 /NCGR_PEP_ID=MMETSP0315-20130426/44588_1 /TAXON_ID=101924 /ORGANISM="Rhodosorus marinus, Strain UTEX LB 2760" /LENGTH=261 /DNA_ID=CAMNT_0027233787 /DNA_START=112 /DNA_END=897 /DNA_ORIENTATION=+